MICPSCNTSNRDDAKFCKKCGQPLRTEAAEAPEAADAEGTSGGEKGLPTAEEDQSVVAEAPGQSPATTAKEENEGVTQIPSDQAEQPKQREQREQREQLGQPEQSGQPEQTGEAAPAGDFPVLATGTTLVGRYEITQVVSEDAQEHVYEVIDHQGYQQCWNCKSEQNREGDEFCIDCGAELLNASYNMHEYPATGDQNADANVLHGAMVNTFVDQGHTYVIEQVQGAENAFPNGVHLIAACDSDAGDVRRSEPNEDSTLVLMLQRVHESQATPSGAFIVADGLGGHENGQLASLMVINIIAERMVRELFAAPLATEKAAGGVGTKEPNHKLDEDALVSLLQGAVEDANAAVCQVNQRDKTD